MKFLRRKFFGKFQKPVKNRISNFKPAFDTLEAREVPHVTSTIFLQGAVEGAEPKVTVYNENQQEVRSFLAYDAGFTGGVRVSAADLDGDGVAEIVTAPGAGFKPLVKIFDSTTGELKKSFLAYSESFTGGVYLAAGEIGLGESGIVTGAGEGGGSHVMVFNSDGVARKSFLAYDPNFRGGVRISLGVSQSGNQEIITAPGPGGGPHIKGFEARSGLEIWGQMAYEPSFRGGTFVTSIDCDNDGVTEFAVAPGAVGGPRVRVMKGETGEILHDTFVSDLDDRAGVTLAADHRENSHSILAWTARKGVVSVAMNGADSGVQVLRASSLADSADSTPSALSAPQANLGGGIIVPFAIGCKIISASDDREEPLDCIPAVIPDPTCPVQDPFAKAEFLGAAGAKPGTLNKVRFGTGTFNYEQNDFASAGYGTTWGTSRAFTNMQNSANGFFLGNNQVNSNLPSLLSNTDTDQLAIVANGYNVYRFDGDGLGNYTERFKKPLKFTHDTTNKQFVTTIADGSRVKFWDFDATFPAIKRGQIQQYIDQAGNITDVTSLTASGNIGEIQRTEAGTTESYLYNYFASGGSVGRISDVTLRRKIGAGAWSTVRKVEYSYYDGVEANGNLNDLKKSVVRDAANAVIETSYYRYYVAGEVNGFQGGLKYAFTPRAYAQLQGAIANPETATDAQIAPYLSDYFEYDDKFRVTKVISGQHGCNVCTAGQGTYTYAYTTSTNADGVNSWKTKTVVTLPDGTTETAFTNAYGQVMLQAHRESAVPTDPAWSTFTKYNSDYRAVMMANPSAVTKYDEAFADLLNNVSNNYQYLSDSAGLITIQSFPTTTTATTSAAGDVAGRLKQVSIQRGETGTTSPQQLVSYILRNANSTDSAFVASSTVYRNDNGTGGITTSMAYTWQGTSTQPASIVTSLPIVTTAQNGSNSLNTMETVFDIRGRPIWMKDENGNLSYMQYDVQTGALTKSITDVNTNNTADFVSLPSGWLNTSGLHLISAYEVDHLGRTTKMTAPNGRVDYTVYNDPNFEVRYYPGWTGSTTTGPIMVSRDNRSLGYTENLTMSATPAVLSGKPTGAETISNLESLSRTYRNAAGQGVTQDMYHNLAGVTYSTAINIGTLNTNYYRTQVKYSLRGWNEKTTSNLGTINRKVFDGLGRVVSEWIGTDDIPTTGFWSPTNLVGTDMVKVAEYQYDGGLVGDSNMTKVTQIPGGTAVNRVTETYFDWRNRPVAVKQGIEGTEAATVNRPITYSVYDNLNQRTQTKLYDGDTVNITTTAGVPNAPAAGSLRAQSENSFDEIGRVYLSKTYSIDPVSGAVGANPLSTNTWYNSRGQIVKVSSPGGLVRKTAYDGARRVTASYLSDGGGDTTYNHALDVVGDMVVSQDESTYDKSGLVLVSTHRDRFHDALATDTGALGYAGSPAGTAKARVSFMGYYYDLSDRITDSLNVGTTGTSTLTYSRPATVPTRSDTELVNSYAYDPAGRQSKVTDPRGIESRTYYDAMGRTTKTIQNYNDGIPGDPFSTADDKDKTTEYTYNSVGMTTLKALVTTTAYQTTEWVYGITTASGSKINSNDIVGATRWPDPGTGNASSGQQDTVTYNALGQTLTSQDRNGTVHSLSYDTVGRITDDAVTTLGSLQGVDGSIMRVNTQYDGQGNAYLLSNYSAASGGTIVNQVQRVYNGFGQMTREYQANSGAVSTVPPVTPSVQYTYSGGASNRSRLTSVIYPNGRIVTYTYDAANSLNDKISRLNNITDSTGILESYQYLGLSNVVVRTRQQTGVSLTYIKQGAEPNGTAGDQYAGLDRFGRIVDQRWRSTVEVDRTTYTYDRNGNRTAKTNTLQSSLNETYTYDGLNQLTVNTTSNTATNVTWSYDAVGNWKTVTTGGTAVNRATNLQNEVTSVGAAALTYDNNGNIKTDETGKQYIYDAWNRIKLVKNSANTTIATYMYDARGYRVQEIAAGATRDLYYSNNWQVLEERVGGVARISNVWSPVYEDAIIARDRDADTNGSLEQRIYVTHDANFNVTALLSSAGAVNQRYKYDPYGTATSLSSTWGAQADGYAWQYLHQGGRLSLQSGLYYFRNRDYSPTLGRWVTMDPIGYASNTANLYEYVSNNPTNFLDPFGECAANCDRPKNGPGKLDEVNGRKPINSDYAGKKYKVTYINNQNKKVSVDVQFSPEGYPDLSVCPCTDTKGNVIAPGKFEIEYTGTRAGDFRAANAKAGLKNTPEGCTWHHMEDANCAKPGKDGKLQPVKGSMMLVNTKCHNSVKHTGGYGIAKDLYKNNCCATPGKVDYEYDVEDNALAALIGAGPVFGPKPSPKDAR